jgi:cellulose synthase/poly-beta-1,6-N-acetylglucosamine synthase-like glycosyltransferase
VSTGAITVGGLADELIRAFSVGVLGYFVLLAASFMAVTFTSGLAVREHFRRRSGATLRRTLRSRMTPPVTICVPAYCEEATIVPSIRAMLTVTYGHHDVVVCNDGSKDRTLERLVTAFEMHRVDQPVHEAIPTSLVRGIYRSRAHPNLVVIDKLNGGRADALNAAINVAHTPLICCVDADSILDHDALLSAVQPFIDRPDVTLGAGGIIRVANGCRIEEGHVAGTGLARNPLALFQTVEYMRSFVAARTGWSGINGLLIISGAFGVFRRAAVLAVGGFAADSIGEDFELCVRLHKQAHDTGTRGRLTFIPDPVCWTEVPERLKDLGGQRDRWHRGLIDTLWRHRRMVGNPRYGAIGMLALPFFVLFEFLGAFIELAGYAVVLVGLATGALDATFAVLFFAVAVLVGLVLSLSAVLIEELAFRRYARVRDLFLLIAVAVAENLGYRQLVLAYRLRGFFGYLRGDKGWGEIERVGFDPPPAPPALPPL